MTPSDDGAAPVRLHPPPRANPLWGLAIAALVVVVHYPILAKPPLLDDSLVLRAPTSLTQPGRTRDAFVTGYWHGIVLPGEDKLYRPLTTASFTVTRAIWGGSAFFARVVNLALLLACCVLSTRVLRRFVAPDLAWLATGIWAVHPGSAAVLQQVVGRSDVLAWLGVLGVVESTYALAAARTLRWWRWCALATSLLLACASKESGTVAVCVPFVVFALNRGGSNGDHPYRTLLATTALCGAVLAVIAAGRVVALGSLLGPSVVGGDGGQMNPLENLSFLPRLPGALNVVATYARLAAIPDTQFYHHPDVGPPWGCVALAGGFALVALVVLAVVAIVRRWSVAVPVAIALGHVLMIANLLVPIGVYAANRLLLPIVFAGAWCVSSIVDGPWGGRKRVAILACGIAVGATYATISVASHRRWTSIANGLAYDHSMRPDQFATTACYAEALAFSPDAQLAIPLFERAIAMAPSRIKVRLDFAHALFATGQLHRAREQLEVISRLGPRSSVDQYNINCAVNVLAMIAIDEARLDDADRLLARLGDMNPDDSLLLDNRIALAGRRREYATMIELLERADRLYPRTKIGLRDRARATEELCLDAAKHHDAGELDREVAALGTACAISPNRIDLRATRARLFGVLGDRAAERQEHLAIIAAAPGNAVALMALAHGSLVRGDLIDALRYLDVLVDTHPHDAAARVQRGRLKIRMGDYPGGIEDLEHAIRLDRALRTSLERELDGARRGR